MFLLAVSEALSRVMGEGTESEWTESYPNVMMNGTNATNATGSELQWSILTGSMDWSAMGLGGSIAILAFFTCFFTIWNGVMAGMTLGAADTVWMRDPCNWCRKIRGTLADEASWPAPNAQEGIYEDEGCLCWRNCSFSRFISTIAIIIGGLFGALFFTPFYGAGIGLPVFIGGLVLCIPLTSCYWVLCLILVPIRRWQLHRALDYRPIDIAIPDTDTARAYAELE